MYDGLPTVGIYTEMLTCVLEINDNDYYPSKKRLVLKV